MVAGQQLTYTLTVTNSGPSDATGVSLVDTLPAGVTYRSATSSQGTASNAGSTVTVSLGNLAVGATATATIVVDVAPATRGTLVNTASVSAAETETNSNNNTANASTDVTARVDLAVTKVDTADPVTAGGTLTYTITVTNTGPSAATGVTLTDTLPSQLSYTSGTASQGSVSNNQGAVTAAIGNLGVGQSVTVTLVTQVGQDAFGTITNVARVSATETETNQANNEDSEATEINARPANISGVVYLDANNNGQQDAGEKPIAGSVVRLVGADTRSAAVDRQVTTGGTAAYHFENLQPGSTA